MLHRCGQEIKKGTKRDPKVKANGPLLEVILRNRFQEASRDPPGILQGPLPRDLSMDADRLPVGMVAFGSVACRTGCLWLGRMYYRNTIFHTYTFIYIYIYICIYVYT